jgi:drug/metabolite transporter (DMT)-like permease
VRRRASATFLAVAVLWGIPYALIKVALEHGATPLLIAWARVAIGAVVLLALAAGRGKLAGLHRHPVALVAIAVCDVAGPFTLLTFGEQQVSSSLAGILVATTPLFVGAMAAVIRSGERPSRRGWLGLLLGFGGVIVLLGVQHGGDLGAAGLILVAAGGYAVATLLVRRLDTLDPIGISAVVLAISTALLAPSAAASLPTAATPTAWAALGALGVLCTAAAFALYYALIAQVGATRAALSVYLAPVFSVAAGALALGEPLTTSALAGLGLILGGSWLARHGPRQPEPTGHPTTAQSSSGVATLNSDPLHAGTQTPRRNG